MERASPGKFVEKFVQCLQHLAAGSYDAKPDVDGYVSKKLENEAQLPEGLRICGARDGVRDQLAIQARSDVWYRPEFRMAAPVNDLGRGGSSKPEPLATLTRGSPSAVHYRREATKEARPGRRLQAGATRI